MSIGISEISRSHFAERDNYSQDLKLAYETMKKEALKNETLKWRDGKEIELYGEKVKMFQSTEKQFKDNKMFGNVNYPSVIQKYNINNNPLDEIGKLNGLGVNANKYSSELLGTIAQGNKQRQDNHQVLNKDYYNYILSPQGRAEAVAPELMLIGGAGNSVSKVLETGVAKGSVLTKEAGSAIGAFANKYPKTYETVVSGTVATVFDIYNGDASPEKAGWNFVLGRALVNKPLSTQLSVNIGTGYVISVNENNSDEKIVTDTLKKGIGTFTAFGADKILSNTKLGVAGKPVISSVIGGFAETIDYKKIEEEKDER